MNKVFDLQNSEHGFFHNIGETIIHLYYGGRRHGKGNQSFDQEDLWKVMGTDGSVTVK